MDTPGSTAEHDLNNETAKLNSRILTKYNRKYHTEMDTKTLTQGPEIKQTGRKTRTDLTDTGT